MRRWKRPELLWRVVLVAVLLLAGLLWLPPAAAPASSEQKIEIPQPGPEEKLIALTFDDGPHPDYTAALLDGLKERGVKATFFLVGTQIQCAPELVSRKIGRAHV